MEKQYDLTRMADTIASLRQKAEELQQMAKDLPAVEKNTTRMLASIKMLELNICDAVPPVSSPQD